jgi:hypothetical protein
MRSALLVSAHGDFRNPVEKSQAMQTTVWR